MASVNFRNLLDLAIRVKFGEGKEVEMLKSAFLIAAGVAVAVPAVAQTTIQPQPVQTATAKSDVNKLVCKKEEQIGSRLAVKKVCLTVQQWQERATEDRQQLERVQQGARGPSSGD
jgi:hypothetical protein